MALCFILIYRGVRVSVGRPPTREGPMFAYGRSVGSVTLVTLFVCAMPAAVAGQSSCAVLDETRGHVWRRVVESRGLEEGAAKSVLRSLQDSLSAEAAARPDDLAVQYELALVLGSRAEIEGGSDKIRAAEAMDRQVAVVLALDPQHAGAQHLHGRLQAAVMRMSGFKRFVATRILGGERLADASWDDARARLEAAVQGDPCVPDYHYELAQLYFERDEPELAALQLDRLFAVAESRDLFADVQRKGRELAEELGLP
jgi:hypothetical protein